MNCANHPETLATAFCRTCGKPLCPACQRPAQGTVLCEEHAVAAQPAAAVYSPYTTPFVANSQSASPGLAFLLGLIPGVGAIYNGQYAKGPDSRDRLGDPDQHHELRCRRGLPTLVRFPDSTVVLLHGVRGISHSQSPAARGTGR